MLRICAWCKKNLEDDTIDLGHEITHGICERCRVALLSSHKPHSIHKYLDYFSLPVLMIDAQGRVLSANKEALDLTGKELGEISNELGGDVMGCKYAQLEGGCGGTSHCVACTIRNNIIRTHDTGESLHKVPAHLLIDNSGQETLVNFLISTEKLGEMVLLRIDKVE